MDNLLSILSIAFGIDTSLEFTVLLDELGLISS